MKKFLTLVSISLLWTLAVSEAHSEVLPASVNTAGRPDLVGPITTDGTNVYFNITAVGQADDGDNINTSKYYTQSNFDNEYFTILANGKFLKYNMFSGNTTPYWGTSWSNATAGLPEGVTFSQTQNSDDFDYAVSMSFAALGIDWGDTFNVQIMARDFNDDYVGSYVGFDGYDGLYSQYRGLYITDTGAFSVTAIPEPSSVAALIGLLATGGGLWLRRRRRRATRAPWSEESRQAIRQIVDHGRTSA